MKRLSQGRFHWWPKTANARVPLSARALVILRWHGDPERAQMARDWRRVASGGARRAWYVQGNHTSGSAKTAWRCSWSATRDSRACTPAERQVAIRLVRTLAIEALCSLLENNECLR